MKSELLATSPLLILPMVALVLFIIVFTAMLITTMKKRAVAYDPLARMPLEDDVDVQKGASR